MVAGPASPPRGVGFGLLLAAQLTSAAAVSDITSGSTNTFFSSPVYTAWSSCDKYLNQLPTWLKVLQVFLSAYALVIILTRFVSQIWRQPGTDSQTETSDFSATALHTRQAALLPPLPSWYHLPEKERLALMERGSVGTSLTTETLAAAAPESQQQHYDFSDMSAAASHGTPTKRRFSLKPSTWSTRHLIVRPPPAPAATTPPGPSNTVFTLEDRSLHHPGLGQDFFSQPNPDYTSSSSTSTSLCKVTTTEESAVDPPRRRSYQKTIPIGVPPASTRLPLDTGADLTIPPSSYPPATSSVLPPPYALDMKTMADDGGGQDNANKQRGSVHGELLSVLDGEGVGWTRHTRVYGGGVCLACAAAGREGGFYGANVTPEEMR